MPEDMPDRMPEDMPDKMPEDMSDRMPEDLPVTKRIDVMVFDICLRTSNCLEKQFHPQSVSQTPGFLDLHSCHETAQDTRGYGENPMLRRKVYQRQVLPLSTKGHGALFNHRLTKRKLKLGQVCDNFLLSVCAKSVELRLMSRSRGQGYGQDGEGSSRQDQVWVGSKLFALILDSDQSVFHHKFAKPQVVVSIQGNVTLFFQGPTASFKDSLQALQKS